MPIMPLPEWVEILILYLHQLSVDSELVVVDWIMPATQSLLATARMVVDMPAMVAALVVMAQSEDRGLTAAAVLVVIPAMAHQEIQIHPLLVAEVALVNIILAHTVSALGVVLELMEKELVAQHLQMELVMVARVVLVVVMVWLENLPKGHQAISGLDLQEITQQ